VSTEAGEVHATTAQVVAQQVNQLRSATGAAKVDIVTHSMGGLSSRYYLKNLGGTANVDEWVSLGGPNHGTSTAALCGFLVSCRQMLAGSAFLNALNSGDETPSTPRYGTWWSPCDEVINPDTSTILSGAANTQTSCLSHSGVKDSASVYAQVREFVR
jgi:triacylglycerol lipase